RLPRPRPCSHSPDGRRHFCPPASAPAPPSCRWHPACPSSPPPHHRSRHSHCSCPSCLRLHRILSHPTHYLLLRPTNNAVHGRRGTLPAHSPPALRRSSVNRSSPASSRLPARVSDPRSPARDTPACDSPPHGSRPQSHCSVDRPR